jgi:hypothetical protein
MEFAGPVYKRYYEEFDLRGHRFPYDLVSESHLEEWMNNQESHGRD